jgi:hypothetical protein
LGLVFTHAHTNTFPLLASPILFYPIPLLHHPIPSVLSSFPPSFYFPPGSWIQISSPKEGTGSWASVRWRKSAVLLARPSGFVGGCRMLLFRSILSLILVLFSSLSSSGLGLWRSAELTLKDGFFPLHSLIFDFYSHLAWCWGLRG